MRNLVLLHGALGDETDLSILKQELSGHFNCFTFTFHGHGKKAEDTNPFSILSFTKELRTFILEYHISGCDIFGYSMGGFVATYFAYQNPSLVSKITTYGTQFNWTPALAKKETSRLNPEAIISKVPVFAKTLEKKHGMHWKLVLKRTADFMLELGDKNPLNEDVLQSIQNEVVILRGSEDKMIDSAFSNEVSLLLPNSSFHEIPDMPHPLQQVDPQKLSHFIARP